jgi:serine/threonine protein phosphatase 1
MLLKRLLSRVAPAPKARPNAVRQAPADTVVYTIGDIHGRLDCLRQLQAEMIEDSRTREAKRRVIVYLGDYVDRGPESNGVIAHLLDHPIVEFEAVHLLGNHERLMLDFIADPEQAKPWFANGGIETLASYGVIAGDRKQMTAQDVSALRDQLLAILPRSHRRFLEGLKLTHREGDFVFVHAGIRPGVRLEDQSEDDVIWIRQPFLDSNIDHGFVVVHGHTITEKPVFRPNRIGIDTGAFSSGCLTGLVIADKQVGVVQARI